MNRLSDRKAESVFFALVFCWMLTITALSPMVADDFSYCFAWGSNARVTSLAQIFPSMRVHRELTNGRVLVHGLVQALLIRPKGLFNLLNAANAVLLLWLFARHLKDRRQLAVLIVSASLLFTFQPAFGEVSLWLTGAVNYSWGVSLFLLFLWPYTAAYLGIAQKRAWWKSLLFFALAFVAGTWSESGVLAMLFTAVCLSLLTRRLDWQGILGILLALAGYVFLMTAPATNGRAGSADLAAAFANFGAIAEQTLRKLGLLYLLWGLCLWLAIRAKGDKKRITLAVILLLAGLGALAAYAFALYFTGRHFCTTVFFTALSVLLLLEQALPCFGKGWRRTVCALLAALFLARFAFGMLDVAVIYKKSLAREALIQSALAAGEREVRLESYIPRSGCSVAFTLSLDAEDWPNYSVADYYGLEKVTGYYPE